MIAYLIVLQFVLPLALIAWLAFAPPADTIGVVVQIVATGLVLLALAWTGMWMVPPFWTPWLFGMLWLVAAVVAWRRSGARAPGRSMSWAARIHVIAFALLGALAAWVAVDARAGRTPASVTIIDVGDPLRGGPYLVLSGGSRPMVNSHNRTLAATTARMAAHRGQSYGIDLIAIDRFGIRASGLRPRDPRAYRMFGRPVFAPCTGLVRAATDGHPDLPVPQADTGNLAGNHVLLDCGDAVIVLAHLAEGSVAVHAGDAVVEGDSIGTVGNSGNTGEPHLHIHAQLPGTTAEPLSGEPLQIRIGGRYLVRNDRYIAPER